MSRLKERNFYRENPVSELLTDWINDSDKTQAEITQELGFEKTNVLTMFKQGRSPFPIKYVIPLAKATGNLPDKLMQVCLKEYFPDVLECIAVTQKGVIDDCEESVLKAWRKFRKTETRDPEMAAVRMNKLKKAFEEIFSNKG
jgi:hypothetical protein